MREYNQIRSRAFLGVCKDATRESAAFAMQRSGVRIPLSPPDIGLVYIQTRLFAMKFVPKERNDTAGTANSS